ncbi:MAG: homoserine kinase [archaeon]
MNNGKMKSEAPQRVKERSVSKAKRGVTRPWPVTHVKVAAPSTSANLGPGFDVFGLAHDTFQDVLEIEVTSKGKIEVEVSGVDESRVSRNLNKNTAGFVANCVADRLPNGSGLRIHIDKGIPVGKGLGSSGASAAACTFGLNRLLGLGLSSDEMICLAAKGETASAGFPHADNVAASILGGFVIVQSYEPCHAIRLSPPVNLGIALALPDVSAAEKKTELARSVLPKLVPIEKMVHNIGRASSMIVGILSADLNLIGQSMVDAVIEPERARLIPGYQKVRQSALAAGAAGVAISGAGPTVIAVVDLKEISPIRVAEAMKEKFEAEGISCRAFSPKPSGGAKIVEEG